MKLKLSLFLSVIYCSVFAQFAPILKGKTSCVRFLQSTTCVVLSENEAFNVDLKKAFEENWTMTPFIFISQEEFEKKIIETEFSFIQINAFKQKDEKKTVGAMALFNGGFSDLLLYLNASLAYVAYDNWGIEKDYLSTQNRLPAMVAQLNNTMFLINDKNISGANPTDIYKQLSEIYNAKAGVLKEKTLLIDKRYEFTKIVSMTEFAKKYGYAYELVSANRIKEAIDNKEADKAVLYCSSSLYKINQVTDCSTYEIIYAEFEEETATIKPLINKFDDVDAMQLNAAVNKKVKDK